VIVRRGNGARAHTINRPKLSIRRAIDWQVATGKDFEIAPPYVGVCLERMVETLGLEPKIDNVTAPCQKKDASAQRQVAQ